LDEHPLTAAVGQRSFAIKATVVWGLVMWLFENHRASLQPSLQSSMQYLYKDSNYWTGFLDFLIYNKRTD
jgi:peroxisomal membrane protein 4